MTNYAIQEQNQDLVSLLAAHFRLLYNPTHAMADAISMLKILPGLRGLWTCGAYNASEEVIDDSQNQLHLTRSGVQLDAASTIGPLATKSFWPSSTAYLMHADAADFDLIGNEAYVRTGQNLRGMTTGMWIALNSVATEQWAMSKWLTTGNQRSYTLLARSAGSANPQFVISGDGSASVLVTSSVTSSSMMFIVGRYRSEVPDISVFVNGTWDTNSTSIPSTIFNSTADFRIGDDHTGASRGFLGRGSLAFLCHAAVPDSAINAYYQMTAPLFGISV